MKTIFSLNVDFLGNRDLISIPFYTGFEGTELMVVHSDKSISFDLPQEHHIYITSIPKKGISRPPEKSLLPFLPDMSYRLFFDLKSLEGRVSFFIIEYSDKEKINSASFKLKKGQNTVDFCALNKSKRFCFAFRIAGKGKFSISDIEIVSLKRNLKLRPETGHENCFRKYSIFFDPSGYKPYDEKHHNFYSDRKPEWYDEIAQFFKGCDSVLDVGCGPGLLLTQLYKIGVKEVVGLERDKAYIKQASSLGINIIEHDLNYPMPFLEANYFDAIVSHQSLDYLSPFAIQNVLRESMRLLKNGGSIFIAARSDACDSGDFSRTIALDRNRLDGFLKDAGFVNLEFQEGKRSFRLCAKKERYSIENKWPVKKLLLNNGFEIKPWNKPIEILKPNADSWDQLSRRDLTLLTCPEKNAQKVNGNYVSYYTGYQKTTKGEISRAIMRAVSEDGMSWNREPKEPVLFSNRNVPWLSCGVACGSVIYSDSDIESPYKFYVSGLSENGRWEAIGIAKSKDGIKWELESDPIVSIHDFIKLKHLALADVIRTKEGKWLLHAEGWIEGGSGWNVFQAYSMDGQSWLPSLKNPILEYTNISWGGENIANPKCLEVSEGCYLLAFNAADRNRRFKLGLAQSKDAVNWEVLESSSILPATSGQVRVESLFLAKDLFLEKGLGFYFFSSTMDTASSSKILKTSFNQDAEWIGKPWESLQLGLYRIQDSKLSCLASNDTFGDLFCDIGSDAEIQWCFGLEESSGGFAKIELHGNAGKMCFTLNAKGSLIQNTIQLIEGCKDKNFKMNSCIRVIRQDTKKPEIEISIWNHQVLFYREKFAWDQKIDNIRIAFGALPDQKDAVVIFSDVWQPAPYREHLISDAQVYAGVCKSSDPLTPDIAKKGLLESFSKSSIGRALVIPYSSKYPLNTFDMIMELGEEKRNIVFPFFRFKPWKDANEKEKEFQINQLEVIWQRGSLFGLKFHFKMNELPTMEVLEWLENKQVLTIWHITSNDDLQWLEKNVLRLFSFPVLLSHFGGYPADRKRYQKVISLLEFYDSLYLITSAVFFEYYIKQAISLYPDRILLGSDSPAISQQISASVVRELSDISETQKTMVLSENLRFLLERVRWYYWEKTRKNEGLRFPLLPKSEQDTFKQGFQIIAPEAMVDSEFVDAKHFWEGYGVRPFYKDNKPWARYLVDIVSDLKPKSVFEFGCNIGRNLLAIKEALPEIELNGIDINKDAIEEGRKHTGLNLVVGDEQTLGYYPDRSFDFVFTISVLDHMRNIEGVLDSLIRISRKNFFFLEVTLPVEGKSVKHFDHKDGRVRESTGASYSWQIDKYIKRSRIWRLDKRPVYMHSASLGPYYYSYLGFMST